MAKQTIYLAGGCFWGMQGYYKQIRGVESTEVGYANGPVEVVTYKEVCNNSGHAEVIKLTYDSSVISNDDLFKTFIRVINPFSLNKQGGDEGVQYRTGIYSINETELQSFEEILKNWEKENGKSEIEVTSLINYYPAEESHQEYLDKNPGGYCHINLHNIPEEYKKTDL